MREIKFRGRDEHGVWHYGYLANIRLQSVPRWDSPTVIRFAEIVDEDDLTNRVDPETVGQSTGLRDANQREIYEGDIVQFRAFPFAKGVVSGIVKYEYGQFLMIYDCFRYAIFSVINDVKVLGNIHDNPELLGVEA